MGSGLLYKYIFAFLSFTIMMISLCFVNEMTSQIILIVFILGLSILSSPLGMFDIRLQSTMDFKLLARTRFVSYILISIFKLLVVYLDLGLLMIALAFSLELILASFFVVYFQRMNLKSMRVSFEYMKQFFFKTWPILITVFVIGLNDRLGVFFINHFKSIEDVGYYSVLFNLLKFLDFLPVAILMTILPKIIETKQRDTDQYKYRFSAIYATMIYLILLFFFGAFFFGEYAIFLFYGRDFLSVGNIFHWGVLGTLTTLLNLAKAKHFILEGLTREWMIYNILSLIFICFFLYFITPIYGILGAIFSYSFGYLTADIFFCLFSKKTREIYSILFSGIYFPFKFLKKSLGGR